MRRTVGGSRGYRPAVPRTPSVPNKRGADEGSVLPTADSHLYCGRFDVRYAGLGSIVHANVQEVFADAKSIDVDKWQHVIILDAVQALPGAAQRNVSDRWQRLGGETRSNVAEMDRALMHHLGVRARKYLDRHRRLTRRFQPERRIEESDGCLLYTSPSPRDS